MTQEKDRNSMRKLQTLYVRLFSEGAVPNGQRIVVTTPEVTAGMEWVIRGEGVATIKYDGSCCAIINNELYKRYDAKNGKPIPQGAIPCQPTADAITGHLPCWVKCSEDDPSDKWYISAYKRWLGTGNNSEKDITYQTFEACGVHFSGNPYHYEADILIPHGEEVVEVERSYEGIKRWLKEHPEHEGLVFWRYGTPRCKIRRKDFGFCWK